MKKLLITLKNYWNFLKSATPFAKIIRARNYCLDEWYTNYNSTDEVLKICRHNRVVPKILLVVVTILMIVGIMAIC